MKWHYFLHLTVWTLPIVAGQWAIGWRVFLANLRGVICPPLIAALFFGLCDSVAVRQGIWFFDPAQILGWKLGPLPIEEVLFFFLTSLLVSQSLILLLPADCRRSGRIAG
jgi:lycopene cyclase domain-containing protein